MRILAVNYRDRLHPSAGGAERHFHQIFSRLAANGHQVVLLTTAFKGAKEREEVDGILVVRSGGDLTFQLTVAKLLPKLDAEFAFDVLYEDLNKLPLFVPRLSKKPHLVQIHHLWRRSIFAEASFPVALGVYLFERMVPFFYAKSKFVAVSPSSARELEELGVSRSRISVIYNGASGVPAGFGFPKKGDYFVWLSRVHRYKGIMTALEAFKIFSARHPGVRLKVAGTGPLLPKLPEILSRLGLEKSVDIEGYVTAARKLDLLAGAKALLQTSEKEGWGLTVIEAAELGTTTIASAVPGLVDSVIDGVTGFLFPVRNAKICADCMERLYANAELRERLEIAAKNHAAEFSWDRAARETEALLKRIAGGEGE